MRPCTNRKGISTLWVLLALAVSAGCESTDGDGMGGGVYYGSGLYDPWYYGGYYDDAEIIVTPPHPERPEAPVRPEHPIASPPTGSRPSPRPMPSIPSAPRPSFRR